MKPTYGWGFYTTKRHNRFWRDCSVGVWAGWFQLDFRRWEVSILWGRWKPDAYTTYTDWDGPPPTKHWWTIGKGMPSHFWQEYHAGRITA